MFVRRCDRGGNRQLRLPNSQHRGAAGMDDGATARTAWQRTGASPLGYQSSAAHRGGARTLAAQGSELAAANVLGESFTPGQHHSKTACALFVRGSPVAPHYCISTRDILVLLCAILSSRHDLEEA
ncbi:uncharacterized protein B0I36DRAFT_433775 [Microdochium trichocladiopsis]|uniref:Uncharacterized protein n=1 Tax=Microdochium trichocladiopsis TaxID=1682393 RepID=A0A9P8Y024_9PEZI|nr:uncharacterized protein B0I36DRAFT_433775 [Microdochium trichocladiopsis]KAH7026297.1 hypothetical protein B0I36DRAFT_433775 [Microdochium trichocladiopsis]